METQLRIEQPAKGVARIVIDKDHGNSLTFDLMIELRQALEDLQDEADVKAVILTGSGRFFCSGADLKDTGSRRGLKDRSGFHISSRMLRDGSHVNAVVRAIRCVDLPIIAAINGAAVGGGFALAMAADIRLAAHSAFFRAAGINNGVAGAELGLGSLLPRAIGTSNASFLMFTGSDLSADDALRVGLVSEVTSDDGLEGRTLEIAQLIASRSRLGLLLTKRLMRAGALDGGIETHSEYEELAMLYIMLGTDNFVEAMRARAERRSADFSA